MNFLRKLRTLDLNVTPICLTLFVGPIRCRKQWFYSKSPKRRFPNATLNRFRNFESEDLPHSRRDKTLLARRFVPGFLIICASGLIAQKIQYFKEKFLSLLPPVLADYSNLTGRRTEYGFIADVANVSAPAVVYIEIRDKKRIDYYTGQPTPISNGSGFVIEPNGLILTNAHVVIDNNLKNNMSILIKFVDGRTFEGNVECTDTLSDLATVRISGSNLPTLQLGHSSSLKPGEWVVALGSPLALSNTVTCGIISAHRKSEELGLMKKQIVYLQTDASINQGNSGGPLLNLDGEAIGINSMKILPGISFAIPIDHARNFLQTSTGQKYAQSSKSSRYIGITMMTITEPMIAELRRRQLSLSEKVREGVLVWKVVPHSPGESGGLHPGDIITHVNGVEVKSSVQIYEALAEKGKPLDLVVYRGQKELKILVKPDE
ncbi:serine protease HTRA2, mitochondrial-like isoform X3 [Hermetia illucens]|uniref:serine protease HTRA2, mitochondrial-like isoform X3 n=1 Tax=Hermetia illucens TaxID=343691 RepID=UPI0018CC53EA|nr:serine protease HTRA2, mitochondrial-like isoform X3 [Hermetia illucens]